MPRTVVPITAVTESLTRPVAVSVIRGLSKLLSIPDNVTIFYPGVAEVGKQSGTDVSNKSTQARFNATDRIFMEVTERPLEDRLLTTAVQQVDNPAIFLDNALGVALRPVYAHTEMNIHCVYRTRGRTQADKIRNDMQMAISMLRQQNLHDISYSFPLPVEFLHLLKTIWELRESVAGYGDSFDEWVSEHISKRATNLTTLVGSHPTLSIAETQSVAWGRFSDILVQPEGAQKEDDVGTWKIEFEYRFQYDKVMGMAAKWPLVVHNQIMPEPWHQTGNTIGDQIDPNEIRKIRSHTQRAFDHFVTINESPCRGLKGGVSVPSFDEWEPEHIMPDTSTLISVMLGVDPEDRTNLLDLRDLGEVEWDDDVARYLLQEQPYLTQLGGSVIHVSLYRDGIPYGPEMLRVRSDLTVRSTFPLDLRERYHLRIAFNNDLVGLSRTALQRFARHGDAAEKILMAMQWGFFQKAMRPRRNPDGSILWDDLLSIGKFINDQKHVAFTGLESAMLSVGTYTIVAHRSSNNAHHADAEASDRTGPFASPSNRTELPECNG